MKFRSRDAVVHLRDPKIDIGQRSSRGWSLGVDYFTSILSNMNADNVYIIAQPNMRRSRIVLDLITKRKAQLYQDDPLGDWSLAVMAPIFIGSFGSFSWSVAYLSEGAEIHLPYISNVEQGSYWHPAHHLFIDDDARVVYHDVADEKKVTSESAADVLSRKTVFARAVLNRTDPCPDL